MRPRSYMFYPEWCPQDPVGGAGSGRGRQPEHWVKSSYGQNFRGEAGPPEAEQHLLDEKNYLGSQNMTGSIRWDPQNYPYHEAKGLLRMRSKSAHQDYSVNRSGQRMRSWGP